MSYGEEWAELNYQADKLADRNLILRSENKKLRKEFDEFQGMAADIAIQRDKFRKALEFYAEIENYQKEGLVDVGGHLEDFIAVMGDYGGLARHTLAKKGEEPK